MDLLSSVVFYVEFAAAVLVIIAVAVVLFAIRDFARRGKQSQSPRGGGTPRSVVTLSEQLKRMGHRPLCYVNGVEIRSLYPRVVEAAILTSRTSSETSSRVGSGGLTTPLVSATATGASAVTTAAEFEGTTDDQLAEAVIARLLEAERVALGLESPLPEQGKIDALDQGRRLFARADAERFVDAKGLLAHRQQLESGGSATRQVKAAAFAAACERFNYVAVVGDFTCHGSALPEAATGGGTAPPEVTLLLSVCGVEIAVGLPVSEIKAPWRGAYSAGASLGRTMVFGHIGTWDPDGLRLTIHPLVIGPNWAQL